MRDLYARLQAHGAARGTDDVRHGRLAPAILVGIAHAGLLVVVPSCAGAVFGGSAVVVVALLSVAAVVEAFASRSESDRAPPLAVASALALLATFWIALLGPGSSGVQTFTGGALLAGGTALRVAAIVTLGRLFVSTHGADGLVCHGVYGHLRHPSETGQLMLGSGAAVAMGSIAAVVWLGAVAVPLTLVRLRREEAGLCERADYARYRAGVPALLPIPAGLRRKAISRRSDPPAPPIPARW